jgi:hypothetical protein
MVYSLNEFLEKIPDFRRKQGLRYPLPVLLSMLIMGILSGRFGYRPIATFLKANQQEFQELFKLKHGLPCHVTLRNILQTVPFNQLNDAFNQWASQYTKTEKALQLSIDGKSLAATVTNYEAALQDFIISVHAFGIQTGLVYGADFSSNRKMGEQAAVRSLIKPLGLTKVVWTLDALHTKKNG